MKDVTKPRQVRVPESLWSAYERVCAKLKRTRAEDINDHIRRQIEAHGDQEDREALAAADVELAERRARKGGRPRIERSNDSSPDQAAGAAGEPGDAG